MFCCTLLYVHSSMAIILMGKRELVALLYLSSWCLLMVEWLFLAVPWGCLWFVIVVFPDHTHYFCYQEGPNSFLLLLWKSMTGRLNYLSDYIPRYVAEDLRLHFCSQTFFWQVSCSRSKTKARTAISSWSNQRLAGHFFGPDLQGTVIQ